jgi:uncharacterized protein (TIGR02147 family)
MEKDIFNYSHYRPYLSARLQAPGSRGDKSALSQAMGIQATYISQVLQEKAHLSLEQGEAANQFFNHSTQESHFFLLLIQKDRAGTKSLREYFQKQMDEILKARLVLTERLGKSHQLKEEDRAWYYSNWIPAAVHIATTIPTLRTAESISKALQLTPEMTVKTLEHLENVGLVRKNGFEFLPGSQQIRLGNDSHHILSHHTNWRLQAMQSLEREKLNELHYSGVVSLSSGDVVKIKNILLDSIKENINIVKESKEEELFCLNIDFFDLRKEEY